MPSSAVTASAACLTITTAPPPDRRVRPAIAIRIGIQAPELCAASGIGASAAWSATSAPRLAKPVAARNANSAGAAKRCNAWLTKGTRAILYSGHTGIDERARHCEGRVGRPGVPRFCVLRAGVGRGSSWLRADAGLGVLPLAPDPEGRRQDAVRGGLARGEVAGPRPECIADDDTVVLEAWANGRKSQVRVAERARVVFCGLPQTLSYRCFFAHCQTLRQASASVRARWADPVQI